MKSVKFISTPTCVKCKSMIPKVTQFCEENNIEITLYDAMTDGLDLVKSLGISSVPTVLVYKDDELISEYYGDFSIKELFNVLSN